MSTTTTKINESIKEIINDWASTTPDTYDVEIHDIRQTWYIDCEPVKELLNTAPFNGPSPAGCYYRYNDQASFDKAVNVVRALGVKFILSTGYDVRLSYWTGFKRVTETHFISMEKL